MKQSIVNNANHVVYEADVMKCDGQLCRPTGRSHCGLVTFMLRSQISGKFRVATALQP